MSADGFGAALNENEGRQQHVEHLPMQATARSTPCVHSIQHARCTSNPEALPSLGEASTRDVKPGWAVAVSCSSAVAGDYVRAVW